MVMDSPAELGQEVGPFVKIDRHLLRLGLSAPEIYQIDEENGFLLLEDFGDATFTRLLASDTTSGRCTNWRPTRSSTCSARRR